jgi:hypothetical protein
LAEAVALFKAALTKEPQERQQMVTATFLQDMVDAGKVVEGYNAAPVAVVAFNILVESCYRDPDLGPILRSESFRVLRERFPEPKSRPIENDWDD